MIFNDTQLVTRAEPGGIDDEPIDPPPYRTDPDETIPPLGPDPEPGRQIAIHYHKHYHAFIATYRCLDIASRARMAVAYADYMSKALGRTMEPYHVMSVWDKAVYGDITLPARVR